MKIYSSPSLFYQSVLSNENTAYLREGVMIQEVGLRKIIRTNDWEARLLDRFIKYKIIDGYKDLDDKSFALNVSTSRDERSEGIIALLAFDTSWHKKTIQKLSVNNSTMDLMFYLNDVTDDVGHEVILKIERILNRRAYNQIPNYNFSLMENIYKPLLYRENYLTFFSNEDDLFSFIMYYTYHALYAGSYKNAYNFLNGKILYGIKITPKNIKYFLPKKIDYHHDPIKFLSMFQFVAQNLKKLRFHDKNTAEKTDSYTQRFNYVPIFRYWDQGYSIDMPEVIKKIATSQNKLNHGNFKVIDLSHQNISEFIDVPDYIEKIRKQYPASYSDYVRLSLLEKYGGVWLDSSIYVNNADAISKIQIKKDNLLYAYHFSGSYRNISNFFLYVNKPNNYIIKTMKKMFSIYYQTYEYPIDYFFFHKIFRYLTFLDQTFEKNWLESVESLDGLEHSISSKILFENIFDNIDEGIWNSIDMLKINRKSNRIIENKYSSKSYIYRILGDKDENTN